MRQGRLNCLLRSERAFPKLLLSPLARNNQEQEPLTVVKKNRFWLDETVDLVHLLDELTQSVTKSICTTSTVKELTTGCHMYDYLSRNSTPDDVYR